MSGQATAFVCATCGVQQAAAERPPAVCPICADERQWVPPGGQRWTTLDQLRADGHRVELREQEPGLVGVGCTPSFGIGQRALLVTTPAGNLLWDCIGLIDEAGVRAIAELGGLHAITCSHPHFHGVMVEWAQAFGAELLVPEADLAWVQRPDPAVRTWSGRLEVLPGLSLVQCGGHFDGSAVLHWAGGAGGRGALLVGDTATVTPDRNLSFMRSYPNLIPLPPATVRRIAGTLLALDFERVYGGWWERVVPSGGREALRRSAERYERWVTGTG
jgi:hypothetical protein